MADINIPRANPNTYAGYLDIRIAEFDQRQAFNIDNLMYDIEMMLRTSSSLGGMPSQSQAIATMLNQLETGSGPFGRYFSELEKDYGSVGRSVEMANDIMAGANYDEALPDTFALVKKQPHVWQCTGVNTCPSCIVRHGQVETWQRWQELGMPRDFDSYCGDHCKCSLTPVATLKEKGVTLDDIRKPVVTYQKRLNEAGETVTGLKMKKLSGVIAGKGKDKMEAAFRQIERKGMKIQNPETIAARRALSALGNFNK